MIRLPAPALAPVDAAARLAGLPGRFLLDSASDADGAGRWSFAGARPTRVLDRLEALEIDGERADDGPHPLAVGYLGYDLARQIERLPARAARDLSVPDVWFGLYDAVWRLDRVHGEAHVLAHDEAAGARLLAELARPALVGAPPRLGELTPDEPAARHLAAVERALEYIRAGDVYQVNLARRLRAPILEPGDALALHAALAPAPFGALLETPVATFVSNSPELFLRRRGARLETRPIKGTRARAADPGELRVDPKELAEHLMIVDLLRNDLGRVARTGSVTVESFARVVSLPTVHHLVSTVACETRAKTVDILRATFPGGSVTGAPKVRAMQIIDELEPVGRGAYTGALGYLGAGGELDLSIVIRTAVLAGGALHLHVGGGIVADSRPARELEETEEKAAAWRDALRRVGGVGGGTPPAESPA